MTVNFRSKVKYGNRKITRDGMTFDSIKEYRRWCELSLLERAGEITGLERQVKYVIVPAQYAPDTVTARGKIKRGKLLERECSYVADFRYQMDGETVVEDVKGCKKGAGYELFKIKRKLMLYRYGIRVKEV
ncbi:DUF1064 domain-containing protein [Pseudoflavonifractor sp. An85]|uniref:DUF1064 domain-containing protein n=1 Tax=Pseudoflavonifractor sp. An85 TaxID=1965661 RepID=UPI000B367319|nr:DUF1064 domain-containing protein [Pseudoflavonifractor sp. An85]OUN20838.1 hypothetical protein B5G37_11915 [Pseudoflavonifractor sp. An85]